MDVGVMIYTEEINENIFPCRGSQIPIAIDGCWVKSSLVGA